MSYSVVTTSESDIWHAALSKLPAVKRDAYFTPEYYRLYELYENSNALCFIYEEEQNIALYPFLMHPVNTLGYILNEEYFDIQGAYGYNGVIYSCDHSSFISNFHENFNRFCSEHNIICEFTRFHPLFQNHLFSEKNMDVVFNRKTVYVDLDQPYQQISAKYQRSTKKQIRKATEINHLELFIPQNKIQLTDELYHIYTESMTRVDSVKHLFFNPEYFRQHLESEQTKVFCCIKDSKIISFITVMLSGQFIHGHLGGTLNNYIKLSPFSFLYDKIIRFGTENTFSFFHFGGGRTSDINDPLLQYKLHFSNLISDFYIGKKIHNQKVYKEVVSQWESKFPKIAENYKNVLLKYWHKKLNSL